MANGEGQRIQDGSVNFEGGVNSGCVPTIVSDQNPTGLKRNQLAWLQNGTVRSGGISPRTGYLKLVEDFTGDTGLFQGAFMYQPLGDVPYMVMGISGKIYRVNVWTDNAVIEISTAATEMPATVPKLYFEQAEEYLIIQAGDYVTLPLIWNNVTMYRSIGAGGAIPQVNREVPAGAAMDYWMGRLWVQTNAREYSAGDIVGGPNGIYAGARDSVWRWTENTWLSGGGAFIVPSQSGSIRSLNHTSNMNTALGQGDLIIGTRDAIFALSVPVNRSAWDTPLYPTTAIGRDTQPLQRMIQNRYGPVSDRTVVPSNSDLFYQAYDGIRSLAMSQRWTDSKWGQVPLSYNVNRVLGFNDRTYYQFASGVEFDNRLYQTCLPFNTPVGVAHKGIVSLDFNILSSLQSQEPPAWEGMLEGLDFMQLLEAESGGLQRAFSVVHSQETGKIQIWELTNYSKTDEGDKRIGWYIEFPAYTAGSSFTLKELDTLEIWLDRLNGTADYELYYRPDGSPCWIFWHTWRLCSARNTCEDVENPVCYPVEEYCEGYRATIRLPKPPVQCTTQMYRPTNIGYQFQCKLKIKGWCRIRGVVHHFLPRTVRPYEGMVSC